MDVPLPVLRVLVKQKIARLFEMIHVLFPVRDALLYVTIYIKILEIDGARFVIVGTAVLRRLVRYLHIRRSWRRLTKHVVRSVDTEVSFDRASWLGT